MYWVQGKLNYTCKRKHKAKCHNASFVFFVMCITQICTSNNRNTTRKGASEMDIYYDSDYREESWYADVLDAYNDAHETQE